MTTFCPFYNDTCKGNQCVMWYNENCLIVNFLQQIHTAFIEGGEIPSDQIGYPVEIDSVSVPDYIKSISPEDLTVEYIDFLDFIQKSPCSIHSFHTDFLIFLN